MITDQDHRTPAPAHQREEMLDRVEARLRSVLNDEYRRHSGHARAAVLVESLAELVAAGGERVRPVVLFTGYLAAGGAPDDPRAIDTAAALELLDTATLLRSDVHDNAAVRRGMPALHVARAAEHERGGWGGDARRYGAYTATLAGDLALACADRLAGALTGSARAHWDELRADRCVGMYAREAMTAAYLDDPWPGRCVSGCDSGCRAGWYALRAPLLIGAALAGRDDLAPVYEAYSGALHAAWRLRGFLDGGPEYAWDAELLREALLDGDERDVAERMIRELVGRAGRTAGEAPLSGVWRGELASFGLRVASE
ncbi:polyprenyl synthetase family protein [Streptomyces herbicida]|uniref:polyprenyl synthetase family protein n=1 Tax=Streptomyces herbicida TaxID=3065675 RepID=UPI002931DDE0|nr:polyprenyl synthetase family protein [Streptomyces sp. NEAU-HV9]